MALFQSYFERFALVSLEKQERLFRALGDHSLDLDLDSGLARFSSGLSCSFQVLGTESENTLTWLWGWADEQTEMQETLLASCRELKAWAGREHLSEFTVPSLHMNCADGTKLSLVSSIVCKASAFYRDHYEGGTLFLLLFCRGLEAYPGFNRKELIRRFRELSQTYDGDFCNILLSYFKERGFPVSESNRQISGELGTGERLIADLDEHGNITSLNGEPFLLEEHQEWSSHGQNPHHR